MPKRCSDTHFYVCGHKTRSGNARYTTPDGSELEVVCGRNRPGPGQIHLRDVPDGVTLAVIGQAGELDLVLDQAATRGRHGRLRPQQLPSREVQPQIVWNNLAELPAYHADYPWAAEMVEFWVYHAFSDQPTSFVPPGISVLDAVRGTNVHRFTSQDAWRGLARDPHRYAALERHAARLCGQVCGMDPDRDRQAFSAALRELTQLTSVLGHDVPPQYHARLVAVLADQAPHLGYQPLESFVKEASPSLALELVSRMAGTYGIPDAATTRALGQQLVQTLLRERPLSPVEEAWLGLGILADEHLAPWHEQVATSNRYIPAASVPVAHQLACPSAATLLETLRADAMVPEDPDTVQFRAERIAEMREQAATPPSLGIPSVVAPVVGRTEPFPAASIPTAERVAKAAGVFPDERLSLRAWDDILRVEHPPDTTIPNHNWVQAYLDCGVTSFGDISRLVRSGVMSWELELLDEAGARTTAQKLACSSHGVRAADLMAFPGLGVTDVSDALRLTRHRVNPGWMSGYQALDVHDPAVMARLGDLDVSPAGLAAFRAAGRTLDEACALAARGVSGSNSLALTAAGIDDLDTQARLCRAGQAYSGPERITGELHFARTLESRLAGDDLVAVIQRKLEWDTVRTAATTNLPITEVCQGLDAGVPEAEVAGYAAAGIRSVRDWVTLSRAKLSPAKVELLQSAGVTQVQEMLPYATAPIATPQDAVAYVAARTRAQDAVSGTAAALI